MARSATTRTSLGVLVRQRREELRLSMDDLASRSRVSRSTLHRIEHDHDIRPTAPKLAQILVVLDIEPEEIRGLLNDEQYMGDVIHWMERSSAFTKARQSLQPRAAVAPLAGATAPGLVAMKEGRIAEVRGDATTLDELSAALKDADWLVMRPD